MTPDMLATLSAQLDAAIARLKEKRDGLPRSTVEESKLFLRIDAALARFATVKEFTSRGGRAAATLLPVFEQATVARLAGPMQKALILATRGALMEIAALEAQIDGSGPGAVAGLLNGFGMAALGSLFEKAE